MNNIDDILPTNNKDINSNNENVSQNKAIDFRITKIASFISKYMLPASLVITSITIVPAVVVGSVAAINVMIVASVALGVIGGIRLYQVTYQYLPNKVRHIADHIEGIVFDLFAKVVLGFSFPFSLLMKEPYKDESCGKQEPILLIHGFLSHRSHWWYIRQRLKAGGERQVYTVNLGHPFHSIEEYTKVLEKKIKEIQKKTGSKTIKLVGHSMGGLVALNYATTLAPSHAENISEIKTIGSPLKGTKIAAIPAKLGIGMCTKQMMHKSDFVKGLKKRVNELKERSAIKIYHLGSTADVIVKPANSALFSKKCPQENVKKLDYGLGHVSMLFSDAVADFILERADQNP